MLVGLTKTCRWCSTCRTFVRSAECRIHGAATTSDVPVCAICKQRVELAVTIGGFNVCRPCGDSHARIFVRAGYAERL
jgi:hypothetical protein